VAGEKTTVMAEVLGLLTALTVLFVKKNSVSDIVTVMFFVQTTLIFSPTVLFIPPTSPPFQLQQVDFQRFRRFMRLCARQRP